MSPFKIKCHHGDGCLSCTAQGFVYLEIEGSDGEIRPLCLTNTGQLEGVANFGPAKDPIACKRAKSGGLGVTGNDIFPSRTTTGTPRLPIDGAVTGSPPQISSSHSTSLGVALGLDIPALLVLLCVGGFFILRKWKPEILTRMSEFMWNFLRCSSFVCICCWLAPLQFANRHFANQQQQQQPSSGGDQQNPAPQRKKQAPPPPKPTSTRTPKRAPIRPPPPSSTPILTPHTPIGSPPPPPVQRRDPRPHHSRDPEPESGASTPVTADPVVSSESTTTNDAVKIPTPSDSDEEMPAVGAGEGLPMMTPLSGNATHRRTGKGRARHLHHPYPSTHRPVRACRKRLLVDEGKSTTAN